MIGLPTPAADEVKVTLGPAAAEPDDEAAGLMRRETEDVSVRRWCGTLGRMSIVAAAMARMEEAGKGSPKAALPEGRAQCRKTLYSGRVKRMETRERAERREASQEVEVQSKRSGLALAESRCQAPGRDAPDCRNSLPSPGRAAGASRSDPSRRPLSDGPGPSEAARHKLARPCRRASDPSKRLNRLSER